ncbi:UbiA prenyltransferase family protein [Tanacetum coccineum]
MILQATLGGCLVNLYTTGINQLSDIEIDKVNKPYLPLASGEFSVETGVLLTSLFAIMPDIERTNKLDLWFFLFLATITTMEEGSCGNNTRRIDWLWIDNTYLVLPRRSALALFKDIPDVDGDKTDGVNSFAIQFGEERVFWISIWLLEMAYGMAIY